MRRVFDSRMHVRRVYVLVIGALLAIGPLPHTASLAPQPQAAVPVTFSTYLGGNGSEVAAGIAFDSASNLYVAGRTRSTNFPVVSPYQAALKSGGFDPTDIFVAKFAPNGRTLIYSTYIGGTELDRANAIAVDSQGQVLITGLTTSPDFPTANARFPDYDNQGDAFVLKLSSDGRRLIYSTFLGGNGLDEGQGIAVDRAGNAYVTGETQSADFPTANARDATGSSGTDAFVTKLSADGRTLAYSTYLGGPGVSGFDPDTHGSGIAVDAAGSAYVLGWTASPSFPTTNGAFQRTLRGIRDVFVSKFSPAGTQLAYSTYYGGDGSQYGYGIAVDSGGVAYITGSTEAAANFPLVAPLQPTYGGGNGDAFVAKLAPNGASLVYSSYFGGAGTDRGTGIAVDRQGHAAITGQTSSFGTFPTVAPPWNASLGAGFFAQLLPNGRQLAFSTQFGGLRDSDPDRSEDGGLAVAASPAGSVAVAGQTQSAQFQTRNPFQPVFNGGGQDAAVIRLNGAGSRVTVYVALVRRS